MEIVFRKEVQCEGKKVYNSELKAQRASHAVGKKRKGKRKVNYYSCSHCGFWHVGKMPIYLRGAFNERTE